MLIRTKQHWMCAGGQQMLMGENTPRAQLRVGVPTPNPIRQITWGYTGKMRVSETGVILFVVNYVLTHSGQRDFTGLTPADACLKGGGS